MLVLPIESNNLNNTHSCNCVILQINKFYWKKRSVICSKFRFSGCLFDFNVELISNISWFSQFSCFKEIMLINKRFETVETSSESNALQNLALPPAFSFLNPRAWKKVFSFMSNRDLGNFEAFSNVTAQFFFMQCVCWGWEWSLTISK